MKNRYKLLILLPMLVFLGGCITKSTPDNLKAEELKDTASAGKIEIVQNNIDLGDIVITGGKVDAKFTFKNTGEEPVVVTGGGTSCMCTTAVINKSDGTTSAMLKMPGHGPAPKITMLINPGEEAELVATFDPMAHGPDAVGPIMRDVTILTNAKDTPELKFHFKGDVVR